ncbi:hypothetical protein CR513_59460, partial [Mucuna pruriens]
MGHCDLTKRKEIRRMHMSIHQTFAPVAKLTLFEFSYLLLQILIGHYNSMMLKMPSCMQISLKKSI